MKTRLAFTLFPALLLTAVVAVHAEEKKDIMFRQAGEPGSRRVRVEKEMPPLPKEPVTFLGVETAPADAALASQLGLTPGTGLVVTRVAEDSPASAILKEHDVLTKLGDQILVDTRQLGVLVRSKNEGDEVTLTFYRGGKETTAKARLVKREMPRRVGFDFENGPGDTIRFQRFGTGEPFEMRLKQLPGMGEEEVNRVMSIIGREGRLTTAGPRVHVLSRQGGKGSTILDLADGNFVFSDSEGSVEVGANDGKRELTVKNARGEVTFKGPINGEDDRKKLPADVVARLNQIEKIDVGFEPGEEFEHDATTIETAPAQKTRIGFPMPPAPARLPRSF